MMGDGDDDDDDDDGDYGGGDADGATRNASVFSYGDNEDVARATKHRPTHCTSKAGAGSGTPLGRPLIDDAPPSAASAPADVLGLAAVAHEAAMPKLCDRVVHCARLRTTSRRFQRLSPHVSDDARLCPSTGVFSEG